MLSRRSFGGRMFDVDDVQEGRSGTHGARLTVRTGTGAAIGVVSKLVNMHSPLRQRIIAGNLPGDGRRGGFGRLIKGDDPADVGVAPEDGDCGAGQETGSQPRRSIDPGEAAPPDPPAHREEEEEMGNLCGTSTRTDQSMRLAREIIIPPQLRDMSVPGTKCAQNPSPGLGASGGAQRHMAVATNGAVPLPALTMVASFDAVLLSPKGYIGNVISSHEEISAHRRR